MSTVWGSAYCWPLIGTTAASLNNNHLLGLPDETNPSDAAGDQAEKTDQESEMEKYTFSFSISVVRIKPQVDLRGGAW